MGSQVMKTIHAGGKAREAGGDHRVKVSMTYLSGAMGRSSWTGEQKSQETELGSKQPICLPGSLKTKRESSGWNPVHRSNTHESLAESRVQKWR